MTELQKLVNNLFILSKQSKVRVHKLHRRKKKCEENVVKDMEMNNFKLCMGNISILEESYVSIH